MRIVIFCHSLISDWNHGNAHFLRGIASELIARGHTVDAYEPADSWSASNLEAAHGAAPFEAFRRAYPMLSSRRYDPLALDLERELDGADLVIVHEWNDHDLVRRIGLHRRSRRAGSGYRLLFHDTHHRSVTDPAAMARYDLSDFDGVLAFGNVIRDLYRREGWAARAWTWHEAADVRLFHPLVDAADPLVGPGDATAATNARCDGDLVWIGNWGDDERVAELEEFLLGPVQRLALRARVHGVRYPEDALERLARAGIDHAGWVANHEVPRIFSRYRVTVHVPRRPYASALPGIPTIRVFEALACGIPLVSAPWDDIEGLFSPGDDFLVARNGREMTGHLRQLLADPAGAASLAAHGRRTILARHTCAHRVDELLAIDAALQPGPAQRVVA
jgi:spore maturation protein CgeB